MPTIVYLWIPLGVVGMLLASWAYSHEGDSQTRRFTVGHLVMGMVFGPLAFAVGVIWVILAANWMKYFDRFLSIELFMWRERAKEKERD